jgi:fused signal recognition particle receptor
MLKSLKEKFFSIKKAFTRAGSFLGKKIATLFRGRTIDDELLEELEEILYEADLGVATATELVTELKEFYRTHKEAKAEQFIQFLKDGVRGRIGDLKPMKLGEAPHVVLIVGVNGNGKTTSIAKLAHLYKSEGSKVLLGAADTFRAAAIDQLTTWAGRAGVEIVKGAPGSDPAAVAFDTVTAAKARGVDLVLIDTAGRLQTKTNLMVELEKIKRSCEKVLPGSPHDIFLVLDATVGQNAIDQAKVFHKYTPLTGIILTKLDGTAKGGIVVAIQREVGVPVKYIGLGEGMEDLQTFDPDAFVDGLFAVE